jgi:AraC family transcriptional activator of pobA
MKETYVDSEAFNTDYFEIIVFKKGKGTLVLTR